ncbi:MAG: tail fiber domain-containing protein [Verrucomicrobia bacterium]|nr:tail fiber domain-containing protein [Verrucomicrobiota bacterium]
MKTSFLTIRNLGAAALLFTFIILHSAFCVPAFAQGTAFTYQGRLTDGTNVASGPVELQLTLWNALTGGAQVAAAVPTSTVVTVTNGLFTMPVDFGAAAFNGADRYVQIELRTTIGPFTLLSPRQKISAAPYAVLAGNVAAGGIASGTYSSAVTFSNFANVFNGTFTGNGGGLSNLNATSLGGLSASNFWKLGGNAGTTAGVNFLGTTDNQALELKANGQRTLRLEPITVTNVIPGASIIYSNAPNVIGGTSLNGVGAGVAGAFIGGGGIGGLYADQGAGYVFYGAFTNRVSANFSAIVGGYLNIIQTNADGSAIGGGTGNNIQNGSGPGVIGGGSGNTMTNAYAATIGGGSGNRIESVGNFTTIAGGVDNAITADAPSATIGGGTDNTNRASTGTIGGGSRNLIGTTASGATISGGNENTAGGGYATVAGGNQNIASGPSATVGGGYNNNSSLDYATVGGGYQNNSSFFATTVGGGQYNISSASYATVPGGLSNNAAGLFSFAAGRRAKANHRGAFVWADATDADFASSADNQFLIRAAGGVVLSDSTPAISFGTTTRQMLDFYGLGFGMGVQTATLYARSNTRFSWFVGGVHSDLENNAGGGTVAMTLTTAGLTVNGTFVSASDRNAKEQFEPLNPREVLDKVAMLPLSKWSYKQDSATRHLGPMAQDFYAAFGVGPDDKHIATVDADGVALAAIQGLNQKLADELKQKETEITELKQRLAKLEQLMNHKHGGAK